ncbi:hypothetical protein SNEBB_010344 [Seison nebaliae]|nr:hypothetical protein SNEBB_010344 [Seison nebaliae]
MNKIFRNFKHRELFDFRVTNGWKEHEQIANWFPGHMTKGLRQMDGILKDIDGIVEVHDSRIAFSGRNEELRRRYVGLDKSRPYLYLLNKYDLISPVNPQLEKKMRDQLEKENYSPLAFISLKTCPLWELKDIVKILINQLTESNRFNRLSNDYYQILIIGAPNVGKSTLINKWRQLTIGENSKIKKAVSTGSDPGVTKCLSNKICISRHPLIYLFDTPGLLTPQIDGVDTALKLSLTNTINENSVGLMLIADYLLFQLNKHRLFKYLRFTKLDEPTNDINILCRNISQVKNWYRCERNLKNGQLEQKTNYEVSAKYFIELYRKGKLGKFILDDNLEEVPLTLQSHRQTKFSKKAERQKIIF